MYFQCFASQTPSFFGLFFIDLSCFVRNPSWRAFLAPQTATYTPKVDFWSHLGFPGVPKMTLGATILTQKGSKWRVGFTARGDLEPTLRPVTPKTSPRTPFLQFGIDFGPTLAPFLMDLGSIWDDHLGWSFGDLSKIACTLFRICLKWCWSHFVIDVSSLLPTSHMTNHPTNHEH